MESKTFKAKIAILQNCTLTKYMETEFLDSLQEDFYQIDKRRLMYLWHFLSDKEIGKLYDIPEYEVKKRRRDFDINPITSTFDRISRETYGRKD